MRDRLKLTATLARVYDASFAAPRSPTDAFLLARSCTVCMTASKSKPLKPTKSRRPRTHKVSAIHNERLTCLFLTRRSVQSRGVQGTVSVLLPFDTEVYKNGFLVNRLTSEDSTESRVWVPSTSGSVRFSSYTSETRTRTYAGNIFSPLCSLRLRRRFVSFRDMA